MSERYMHTLIPRSKHFIPSAMQVQMFLQEVLSLGVVPAPQTIILRTPSGKTRTVINPLTGEPQALEISSQTDLRDVEEIREAIRDLRDLQLEIAGCGRPKVPPLPVAFGDPYYVTVTVRVSSRLRSTSNLHSCVDEQAIAYGKPCDTIQPIGYFTNPQTGETIEVPDAGCACFWIEVELGKLLFPEIENGNLEILAPEIVSTGTAAFDVPFAQGCRWG